MFTRQILALGLCLLATPAWSAGCAPPKLVKLVVRMVTPALPADAFARQPKTIYRQGATLLRIEEAPDLAHDLHLLTVISEPDVWVVNFADQSGKHLVDRGPDLYTKAAIIGDPTMPPRFMELEFGCEAEFVRAYAPKSAQARTFAGRPAEAHVLTEGAHKLELLMDAAGRPMRVTYLNGKQPLAVIDYDSYEADLPAQPQLFAQPTGLNYVEGR